MPQPELQPIFVPKESDVARYQRLRQVTWDLNNRKLIPSVPAKPSWRPPRRSTC
jgi:hypothetical protein